MLTCEPVCWLEFQSTLSVRRATIHCSHCVSPFLISIHALRKESDCMAAFLAYFQAIFQSTLSVRRATQGRGTAHSDRRISIHALRKESDLDGGLRRSRVRNFNPRSP